MNKLGPIIIIEDDEDDLIIISSAFNSLNYPNEILYFTDGEKALNALNNSDIIPFLILSDINMPKLDGFALRDKIKMDAKLQLRCIPYIFFSTSAEQEYVIKAYSLSAQGFFKKENSFEELKITLNAIIEYWKRCSTPNYSPR